MVTDLGAGLMDPAFLVVFLNFADSCKRRFERPNRLFYYWLFSQRMLFFVKVHLHVKQYGSWHLFVKTFAKIAYKLSK